MQNNVTLSFFSESQKKYPAKQNEAWINLHVWYFFLQQLNTEFCDPPGATQLET